MEPLVLACQRFLPLQGSSCADVLRNSRRCRGRTTSAAAVGLCPSKQSARISMQISQRENPRMYSPSCSYQHLMSVSACSHQHQQKHQHQHQHQQPETDRPLKSHPHLSPSALAPLPFLQSALSFQTQNLKKQQGTPSKDQGTPLKKQGISRNEHGKPPAPPSLSRRLLFSLAPLSSLLLSAQNDKARAENVRLEDVDSLELQQALEAAIGGDMEGAEVLFSRMIESNKGSASMWSNRGSVRMSLGKLEEAVDDFSEAIRLAPYAAVPFLNRAIAYEALGRYDEAADDCESAINNDAHESAAWFNLGNIETKRAKYQKALAAYETAADLAPGIAAYRLREANSLFQVGFGSDAEKLIRSIVRKYPNYAEAHAALAGVLWGEGMLGPAEEQLTEAVEYEPNFRIKSWVVNNVEWPPKLLKSYNDFLTIK